MKDILKKYMGIVSGALNEKRDLSDEELAECRTLQEQIDKQEVVDAEVRAQLAALNQRVLEERVVPAGARKAVLDDEPRLLRHDERLAEHRSHDVPEGWAPRGDSFGRIIRSAVTGDWSRAEHEQRAMLSGSFTTGGVFIPELIADQVLDNARAKAVVMQAGMQTMPMAGPSVTIARITTDPTAYWTAENSTITASDGAFDGLTLSAKKLAFRFLMSLELIEDAPNVAQLMTDAASKALANEIDRVSLYGTGAAGEPLGLKNDTSGNLNTVDVSNAALTDYSKFGEAIEKILMDNGPADGLSVIMNPECWGMLDALESTGDGADGQPLQPIQSWNSLRKFVTTQVSATAGTGSANTECFLGDFSQLVLGVRRGLTVEVSREANDAWSKGQVEVRGYWRGDVGILRPEWFCHIQDIDA